MSRLKLPQTIINLADPQDALKWTQIMLRSIVDEFNGRVSFVENVQGVVVPVTFAAPNTTVEVTHALNYIPSGYIVVGADAALTVYDGTGTSTKQVIYLQADATGTARIKIF